MGVMCTIDKEKGGHCTGFDGIIDEKIIIPAGTNGWLAHKIINEKIPCETCSDDAIENFSGLQDVTNLSIGEINTPYDYDNLKKFVKKVNHVWDSLGHDVK